MLGLPEKQFRQSLLAGLIAIPAAYAAWTLALNHFVYGRALKQAQAAYTIQDDQALQSFMGTGTTIRTTQLYALMSADKAAPTHHRRSVRGQIWGMGMPVSFTAKLCDTPGQRAKGLQGQQRGNALFTWTHGHPKFWMKNCPANIYIFWLAGHKVIGGTLMKAETTKKHPAPFNANAALEITDHPKWYQFPLQRLLNNLGWEQQFPTKITWKLIPKPYRAPNHFGQWKSAIPWPNPLNPNKPATLKTPNICSEEYTLC